MLQESNLNLEAAARRDVIDSGTYWFGNVDKGQTVQCQSRRNQAADVLFYNKHDPKEHYSAMDTIREQATSIDDWN